MINLRTTGAMLLALGIAGCSGLPRLAPTRALGLERIDSGFTGYSNLSVEEGIAHLYLVGPCASNGATYTIAQPILANLLPFPEIDYVKIYDEAGTTENPEGPDSSIPG